MTRLAILDDYQNAALTLADWASLRPRVEMQVFHDTVNDLGALAERLKPFAVIVAMRERTPFPAALIEKLPNLRLLVTTGMRNASIDLKAAGERGVVVCGTEMLPYPTAELTWGLILAVARQIAAEDRGMRDGQWQTTVGVGLKGKVLGLVGLGRLGGEVARIGRAFNMEVIAWSQNLTGERATAAGAKLVAKDELFRLADFISIHLVLSQRSRGIVGAGELAQMKPGAYLVNTSRGPIVDTEALVAALENRRIAGAALDVYDEEPLPASHKLRTLANVVLTPHLGYVIAENYRLAYGNAVEDVRAFLDGKPVRVLTAA
ncbi:MAG: D-2-hydroxyacid dehydrogenase family protein [Proteobacteria bacterium]|nr:D-2-hydroxyacid dehydrogenase family protein [Pseudomonadota bacterium]